MGYGGGGKARAGCAVFSMAGLLVGVGLTVWLGSVAADRSTSDPARPERSTPYDEFMGTTSLVPATGRAPIEIDVTPNTGLRDGQPVMVTSNGFTTGDVVSISLCVAGADRVIGPNGCDAATTSEATVDAQGHFGASVPVRRVLTAGGLPFDCTTRAGQCVVQVLVTEDQRRQGAEPLAFAAPSGLPEISVPG